VSVLDDFAGRDNRSRNETDAYGYDTTQPVDSRGDGGIERRSAALLVVGALKLDDEPVLDVVRVALENGNIILKDYALRYCEEVRPKACIAWLLPLLHDSEKEMAERAVRLLSSLGQVVVRPLMQQAKIANRAWSLRAAQVLGVVRGKAVW
jgi:hypothetical protein